MNTRHIIGSARSLVGEARSKIGLIGTHGKDLADTGTQTLQAARDVILESRKEAIRLFDHTRSELLRTLNEGRAQIRYKLAHLATPTHKEQAEARKAEIKEKKQRKSAGSDASPGEADSPQ